MRPSDHNAVRGACWVLLGPTAGGKTALSVRLARAHPLEIVSVDSRQVYRGMDLGTAKPSASERDGVPHHMIDVVDPGDEFNVARYCEMAREAMRGIWDRGARPLLVCGSPLYLKGLLWGLFKGPGADAGLRETLGREAQRCGVPQMHRRLAEVDAEAARRIEPTDWRRIERALEVHGLTGEPISARQEQFEGPPMMPYVAVGLQWPRDMLYERINRRVDDMMAAGLLDEVTRVGGSLGPQARQAVGYKELIAHLEGQLGLDEAVGQVKRNTRRLAKHQMTWFRHFPSVVWLDMHESLNGDAILHRVKERFLSLTPQGL